MIKLMSNDEVHKLKSNGNEVDKKKKRGKKKKMISIKKRKLIDTSFVKYILLFLAIFPDLKNVTVLVCKLYFPGT